MIHPGRDRYEKTPGVLRGVLFLHWCVVFAVIDLATKLNREAHERRKFCEAALEEWDSTAFEELRRMEEDTKKELWESWCRQGAKKRVFSTQELLHFKAGKEVIDF
jgi:hypothetical protein